MSHLSPDGGAADRLFGQFDALPGWMAQVLGVLFDGQGGQGAAAAEAWARRVRGELERLRGRVPFSVVHDWHARTVVPVVVEAWVRRGEDAGAQEAVRGLHTRALDGERPEERAWGAALGPALREVYQRAYAFADAFATARANAHAYAVANGFGADGAVDFAESYAELNTSANAESYAYANAAANARAMATAFARADELAYAESYPFAYAQACVFACTDQVEQRPAVYGRLAGGLAESLARA